jgi:hypothetical protein
MIIGGNGNDMVTLSNVAKSVILGDLGTISFQSASESPISSSLDGICVTTITSVTPSLNSIGVSDDDDTITTSSSQSTIAIGGSGNDVINSMNSEQAIICGDHCTFEPTLGSSTSRTISTLSSADIAGNDRISCARSNINSVEVCLVSFSL